MGAVFRGLRRGRPRLKLQEKVGWVPPWVGITVSSDRSVKSPVSGCLLVSSFTSVSLPSGIRSFPSKCQLREPGPPEGIQLLVEPEGGIVAPGGTVTLTCAISAQPPPQVHWIKDGAPLPLAPSPVLLLPEVGHEDEGTYSCVATHPSHGPQESPPVSIRVTETGDEGPAEGEGLD